MSDTSKKTSKKTSWTPLIIASILLGVLALGYTFYTQSDTPEDIARKQLSAIQDNSLLRAYKDYTSRNYQKNQSFEQFASLVSNSPVFAENRSAHFYNSSAKGQHVSLTAVLTARDLSISPVLYDFISENEQWKINGLQLLESGALRSPTTPSEVALEDSPNLPLSREKRLSVIEQIETFLHSLKNKDPDRAYNQFASEEFKNATPIAAFRDFVQSQPIFQNHQSVSFGEGAFDERSVTIKTILHDQNRALPIIYTLKSMDGKWELTGLKLLAETGEPTPISQAERQILTDAVRKQLNSLKQEDLYNAYQRFASRQFKATTSLPEFEQFIANYPELKTYRNIKFGTITSDEGLKKVPVTLIIDEGESEIELWLVKEGIDWKLWGMNLTESAHFPVIEQDLKLELAKWIEKHLQAISEKDFSKAYYAFSSKEFEKSTSLDKFKVFLKTYPIFFDFPSMQVEEGLKEGELTVIRVALTGSDNKQTVDYRLVQEGGKWKLWGIQVLDTPQTTISDIEKSLFKEQIARIISDQIDAIRSKDISKAYYAFSAPEFEQSTSKKEFDQFILSYPELEKNDTLEIGDIELKGDSATAAAKLLSKKGGRKTFFWRFLKSDDRWKVVSIERTPQEDDFTPPVEMKFTKALIGSEVDLQGRVIQPNQLLKQNKEKITLNLFVENGKPGAVIEVTLRHVDSDSQITPVNTALTAEGDAVITFIFSPPTQGWPTGKYLLQTTSTNPNLSEEYFFEVE